jgi:hypothetical protein
MRMGLLDIVGRRLRRRITGDLTGWFDLSGDIITGWVVDRCYPENQGLTVSIMRGNAVLKSARVTEPGEMGWCFSLDTDGCISALEVLHERVQVVASDQDGNSRMLKLEGSTQLQLIQEHLPGSSAPLLEIDFRKGGNSERFVTSGWSGQEKTHRWSEGAESTLAITGLSLPESYDIVILLWPFTVPGQLAEQRLEILGNGTPLKTFGVTHQSFLRCKVPSFVASDDRRLMLRFMHPDAARPIDLGISGDTRRLALAFKKLKILPGVS